MKATATAFLPETLSQEEVSWLIHFRKAKTINTLELMTERAERVNAGNLKVLDDINTGFCAREQELLMLS
ncbi:MULTISPECIES: hypothetical protein [Shewanella]|uniref:hypothetical protein n=1 Tax=Shewanella TaxID=22 RepID=UPI000B342BB7|nr:MULTISPECIES: hypothetical protein [Shewanella]AYV11525.1 hypothetical protein EEY24_00725 [Shewanella algae]QXN27428.1 hypothetical protein KVP08_023335 [Shewanella putrefaciens]